MNTNNHFREILQNYKNINFLENLNNDTCIEINTDILLNILSFIKTKEGPFLLLNISCQIKPSEGPEPEFHIIYSLLRLENYSRIQIILTVHKNNKIPSIKSLWKNAIGFEQEIAKHYNLDIENSTESYPQIDKSYSKISIGPFHPVTESGCQITFLLGEENIMHSEIKTGLNHRGLEKMFECVDYNQIGQLIKQLNPQDPMTPTLLWYETLEKLYNIPVSKEAQATRILILELGRIIEHLFSFEKLFWYLKSTPIKIVIRKNINYLKKVLSSFFNIENIKLGGLQYYLSNESLSSAIKLTNNLYESIKKIQETILTNKSWQEQTELSTLSSKDVMSWGITGPWLRSCGINFDVRKNTTSGLYQHIDFEVPLSFNGTPYDLYLVKSEEIIQSIKIIKQILKNIPCRHRSKEEIVLPQLNQVQLSKFQTFYHSLETSNGELGIYLTPHKDKNIPLRLNIRSPCFSHFQSFPEISKKKKINEAMIFLISMNLKYFMIDK